MEEIKTCSKWHTYYPKRLLQLADMPPQLFIKGALPTDSEPSVAIVGARMCSNYGKAQAYEYARVLSQAGVQIISGMARGIDGYAHRGALEGGGRTFAVLGCGVDICYPRENLDLYRKIPKQGGILSEYENNTPPFSRNFPRRNRIISALADIVLVIEAKERSGSLITVDAALEQGKTVFALPGRVCDELSKGCNRLISQGAGVADTPKTLLDELQIEYVKIGNALKKTQIRLETKQEMVYSCLDLQPQNLQELFDKIPLSREEIIRILVELELEGLLIEPMKNYYAKIK